MNDCIFCKIISGEFDSAAIFENDEFKVILDRFPASAGHALVLPKNHVANIFEIDPDQAGRAFALAVKIAAVLKEAFGLKGLNIVQNNGFLAGQTVEHFHIHLIPRYDGDTVDIKWQPTSPSEKELDALKAKISAKL